MGLKFRKSFNLTSGIKMNMNKKSVSTSLGTKGLSVNTGTKGTFFNVGLPGTGISYRTKIFKKGQKTSGTAYQNDTDSNAMEGAITLGVIIGAIIFLCFDDSFFLSLIPIFLLPSLFALSDYLAKRKEIEGKYAIERKNTDGNLFILLIPMILVLCIGAGFLFFLPHHKSINEIAKTQVEVHDEAKPESEQPDTFDKKYQVLRIYDEDVSYRNVPRFTRAIKVKLGLSAEELRDNLIHAAWEMQKEKDARAVWIFAYRPDDVDRYVYTAGRCILAPFGDVAKATDSKYNSISNLTPVVDIAEVYFANVPPLLKADTNVAINTPNTKLYRTRDIEPDDVIAYLKKGQRAVIVGSMRSFTTDEFSDFYMIQLSSKGKKSVTGWVSSNALDEVQDTPATQLITKKKAPKKHK